MELSDVIWVDPDRCGGHPCFKNTRIPVWILIDYLEAGRSIEDFVHEYPDLPREMAYAYVRLAHENLVAKAG